MFIEAGKRISVRDLLSGIVIQSGNDATVAMAEYVAGSEEGFVDFMNAYASELGLSNTLFQNAVGWTDPNHFSSAKDLAHLTKALINNFGNSSLFNSLPMLQFKIVFSLFSINE